MQRHALLFLPLLLGCASSRPPYETIEEVNRAPRSAAALIEALRDTASATRVYLPQEVARPAESLDEAERQLAVLPSGVEATVRVAAVRGIIDTLGFAERATLTVLPGSDPREGAIILRRATDARWRPARLATGRAVRQLFEWRFCRTGGVTCADFAQKPMERGVPRVGAP